MKRLWAVVIAGVLSVPALAQVRGVPASVTSITPTRSVSGIPASVTSLGPMGPTTNARFSFEAGHGRDYGRNFGNHNFNSMCSTPGALIPSAMGCTSTFFTNQMYGLPYNSGTVNLHSHGHRGYGGYYYPVYVPYAVPVVVEPVEPDQTEAQAEAASEEPPAYTVFENRPTSAVPPPTNPPIDQSRVYRPEAATPEPAAAAAPSPQRPPVVLVYKDGHQRELQNYAIVGQYVYDISGFTSQKIPLTDLNLDATVKANDDRGIDFTLPAGPAQ